MKQLTGILAACILILGLAGGSEAQSDNHSVTVTLSAINTIDVDNDVTLTINSATPGQDPDPVVDNATAELAWTTNASSKKITVETDLAAPNYTLEVEAINQTAGTPAGKATLSTTAADFLTGVGKTAGTCDLEYTASATVSDDPGTEVHTVTYTMTNE